MHSDVYKWISFRLGVVIDTNVVYILIVKMALASMQGHRRARKQNLLR